jgi:hypothetical protein
VKVVDLQYRSHQDVCMVEHCDSLPKLLLHIVAQHLNIARTASPLDFAAFEASFDWDAVLGPVKTVHEPVFGLVITDTTNLDGVVGYSSLVNDAVELNQILPVWLQIWLQSCIYDRIASGVLSTVLLCVYYVLDTVGDLPLLYVYVLLWVRREDYLRSKQDRCIAHHTVVKTS